MLILGIDTSGKVASVSLMQDDVILATDTMCTTLTHSQTIMPMCKALVTRCGKSFDDLDRIAVCSGPGSYTGLRIGIAGAKAMCFALGIGCNGVSTLESLANNVIDCNLGVCSIIKARQDLVYCAVFKANGGTLTRLTPDAILSTNVLNDTLLSLDGNFVLVGDGAKEFYTNYSNSKYLLSSPHSRLQSASSLCEVASKLPAITPQELQATYLQPTKAEKDLLNK